MGDTQRDTHILTLSEITQELTDITNKGILPKDVVQKIHNRIQKNNIQLTRNQLYQLITKINTALKQSNTPTFIPPQQKHEKTSRNNISSIPDFQNNTMQQLIDTIGELEQRLEKLEQTTYPKTKKHAINNAHESIEPLQELTNDAEHIVVLMKWLQYLVDKTGKNQLTNILNYYVDIGWISDDVRLDMLDYAKGIIEEPLKEGTKKQTIGSLTTRDHIQSLLYIQKLKDQQIDDRFISRIDREMDKLSRSIDQYQMK